MEEVVGGVGGVAIASGLGFRIAVCALFNLWRYHDARRTMATLRQMTVRYRVFPLPLPLPLLLLLLLPGMGSPGATFG